MNFSIPRNNEMELLLYIWKVKNLPDLSEDELLYTLSFDLFLIPPEKAQILIRNSLKNNFLKKNKNSLISLSEDLENKLKEWNFKREEEIKNNLNRKKKVNKQRETPLKSKFGPLLKAISDKGSIDRAVSINNNAVNILVFNINEGQLKAEILGSIEKPYKIEIDCKNLTLIHNCHDFITRRSKEKKFCKHLVKLFLNLKEINEESAQIFLQKISQNIDEWEFSG